jgi:exportin-2 (importin alpha re-exporter)
MIERLWSQILGNFVVPQVSKLASKDRKVAAVGLICMLTQSQAMLAEPNVTVWYAYHSAFFYYFH